MFYSISSVKIYVEHEEIKMNSTAYQLSMHTIQTPGSRRLLEFKTVIAYFQELNVWSYYDTLLWIVINK